MSKLCIVYNMAPRYREAIFREIDREFDCDWFFGKSNTDIKEMDLTLLKQTKYYKSYGNPSIVYWQGALIPSLFKRKYQNFLVLAETRSLTFWLFVLIKTIFYPNKKIYGWTHGWYGKEGRLQKKLDRWRYNRMDGTFVYNRRAKSLMIEGGVDRNKIFVIGNSLDYNRQLNIRNNINQTDIYVNHFGNNYPVIIFIGRLTEIKRIDLLIEAISRLRLKGENYNLVLIGDGVARRQLEELAEQHSIPVWFYGASYDEEINAELVYNADLCVSPGNVGLTCIHSLMFGTPVITNDDLVTQMPESEAVQDGITGSFFKKNDVSSLADAISKWFASDYSRDRVRQACYDEIERQWNPNYQMKVIKENLKIND